jgi:malonyl-ACP O-methyltransferase BioC/dethiobiotin synthase
MKAQQHIAQIRHRFGEAAARYEEHADVQRETAARLAQRIARLPLPRRPHILEIGCGTGLLSRALATRIGEADWTLTDISPRMLDTARATLNLPGMVRYQLMDGEHPSTACGDRFDLICASLSTQWFTDLNRGLAALCALLAPGGYLCIATLAAGTFDEWKRAHADTGFTSGTPCYPAPSDIGPALSCMEGVVENEHISKRFTGGLQFLRGLRGIGATTPADHHTMLSATALRRVLQRFDASGSTVTYQLAFGNWRKSASARTGVFVTGTDTGIGKTLVSAILARAWNADYWKPLQTGLADEPGDTETVMRLAELTPSRVHAPFCEWQAALSPWAAAAIENKTIDANSLRLPPGESPIIVEGAGGLHVPIDDTHMMIDLATSLGLPVVLVARSSLGTINHTLLSLEALRRRSIPVLGVIMSGALNPDNKAAIERFGAVKVLMEIPPLESIDSNVVARLAREVRAFEHYSPR